MYVIAKYIRLSVDDAVSESLSIQNQRALLDRHIATLFKTGATGAAGATVLEFVDNGYSGTHFDRPAVQRLFKLASEGDVQCVVCKDFSRFGRSMTETGHYIERFFPARGVRFISVDNKFDSAAHQYGTGGMDTAFTFLLHEFYSTDLSKKVTSAKRVLMARGEYITANAVYGYEKGADGRLAVDADAAAVVRRIFAMALDGQPPARIADILHDMETPPPRVYRHIKAGKKSSDAPNDRWTAAAVRRVLANQQYTGTYIAGRQTPIAIGARSKQRVARDAWIVIPAHHPALVDAEQFAAVQTADFCAPG